MADFKLQSTDDGFYLYQKLPIIVKARKVTEDTPVTTVDGNEVTVPAGAYLVIDSKGFPYPCDAEIFEANHVPVPHTITMGASTSTVSYSSTSKG